MAAGDKCATDCTNLGKPSASAPKPAAPVPDKKDDKKPSGEDDKLAAPTPRTKPDVALVLPSSNPKSHSDKGGKPRPRSTSKDKAGTFSHFHFNKGNCKHGDKCPYSHSQHNWEKSKKKGKGRGKSKPPGRSQTPGGKKTEHGYGWMKDGCKRGDKSKFKHDPKMKRKHAAPSTPRDNN